MKKKLLVLGVVVALLAAATVPAFADDQQAVTCTVTARLISISVTPPGVDYGVMDFETNKSSAEAPVSVTFTATNMGTVAEDFWAKGADAKINDTPAWTIVNNTIGTNQYMHSVTGVTPAIAELKLLTTEQTWAAGASGIAPAGTQTFTTKIYMPAADSAPGNASAIITIIAMVHE